MLLVLSLSLCLAWNLSSPGTAASQGSLDIWQAAPRELAIGITLGLGILFAFAAFSVAGRLLDVQVGFGIAQVIDPVSRRQVPILTSLFDQTAILVFFLVNGHHALLRGLAYSVERFPLGSALDGAQAFGPMIKQAGGVFSLGFALVAPVVFCIVLADLVLGVVARNLPQMNMFAMGIPIKIVLGLIVLSVWFTGMGSAMTQIYLGIVKTWSEIF